MHTKERITAINYFQAPARKLLCILCRTMESFNTVVRFVENIDLLSLELKTLITKSSLPNPKVTVNLSLGNTAADHWQASS